MLRVFHVITGTNVGGAEIMLFRYLRSLGEAAQDHAVISLLPHGPISECIKDLGVPVDSLDMRNLLSLPRAIRMLAQRIDATSPDIVHGWMYHGSFAASLATRQTRRGAAVIWGIHHSLHDIRREKPATRLMLRLLARRSHGIAGIVYCSERARQQHRDFGFSGTHEALVPNAIDCDEFMPDAEARQRLCAVCKIDPSRIIIGTVARAHPMKDHVTLIRALSLLLRQGWNLHGVLIGNGHEKGAAWREAARLGISDRLSTLPSRNDIAQLVPGFDVFVLSSAWGEAQSLALGEAMSSCVPSIVTNVGDCAEMVGDPRLVAPPAQPQALAQSIAGVLSLPQPERTKIGLQARDRIRTRLSMQQYIRSYSAIYQTAAARRSHIGQVRS